MKPTISIITPAFNADAFIADTIQSVKAQTYPHWEHLIVVDHKSSDKTLEIVQKIAAQDSRIKLIEDVQAQGVAANRNLAIQKATGDYIAFLDSDDLWHPQKLERQVHFMITKNISFSFHSYQPISLDGQHLRLSRLTPTTVTYESLLADNCIGCLTVMLKNEANHRYFFQNEYHEDYCLWLDILKDKKVAYGMPEVLAYYRIVPNSRSNDKRKAALWRWQILHHREKLGLIASLAHFAQYAFNSLKYRLSKSKASKK